MKLLVAVDFSPASDIALKGVAARLWPPGTTATVLNVCDRNGLSFEHAGAQVATAAGVLRAAGLEPASLVLTGDPKTVIVEQARRMEADFIFVGSHGSGGIAHFLLGSVGQAVVRHAPCSVEVVRAPARERQSGAGMRILLATDGSESSLNAARMVAALPWPKDTLVRVFNVLELIGSLFEAPYLDPGLMEQHRAESMERSQAAVTAAERMISDAGLTTSESISVLLDAPKHVIAGEAAEWGADLIVLGVHGHTGLDRFLPGRVSEGVAIDAGCSVDVIRKKR